MLICSGIDEMKRLKWKIHKSYKCRFMAEVLLSTIRGCSISEIESFVKPTDIDWALKPWIRKFAFMTIIVVSFGLHLSIIFAWARVHPDACRYHTQYNNTIHNLTSNKTIAMLDIQKKKEFPFHCVYNFKNVSFVLSFCIFYLLTICRRFHLSLPLSTELDNVTCSICSVQHGFASFVTENENWIDVLLFKMKVFWQ